MSDFLGHLAARAIAQPSLRPRTRSRFEPGEAEETPLNWPVAKKDETAPTPAIVQRRAIDHRAVPEAAPPSRFEPPAVNQSIETPSVRGAEVSSALPRDSAADAAPERTERPLPEGTTRVVREVEQQTEYVAQPVTEIVEREVRVPVATHGAQPKAERKAQHRFEREAPQIIRATPRVSAPEVQARRSAPSGLPAPHRGGSAKRVPEQGSAASPEPVIEVSIGRIEVRAVPAASGSRSPGRPAAMSIDDYVAKRKAKERR